MSQHAGKVKKNRYGIIIPHETKNLITACKFGNLLQSNCFKGARYGI